VGVLRSLESAGQHLKETANSCTCMMWGDEGALEPRRWVAGRRGGRPWPQARQADTQKCDPSHVAWPVCTPPSRGPFELASGRAIAPFLHVCVHVQLTCAQYVARVLMRQAGQSVSKSNVRVAPATASS